MIFDGLDELTETSDRQVISRDIENFCSLYSSVPVIVTSREVGYKQAPLDDKVFSLFKITSFDEKQVLEYATKWFKLDDSLPEKQCESLISGFMADSELVDDLRSNPLMLGLMCNIYRCERYIPKNRPDVYEKCAEMLFESWDKKRGIHAHIPFETYLRPAMEYLANWIYIDETLQSGVTEEALCKKTVDRRPEFRAS